MGTRFIIIDENKKVLGNFACHQIGYTTYEIDEDRLNSVKQPWMYDPDTDILLSDEDQLKARLEKQILDEYDRRISLITVDVSGSIFSVNQSDDINGLVTMINEGMIIDGQAQLSTVDKRVRPYLTKVQLKEIGGLIAYSRNSLAEIRKLKLEALDACVSGQIQTFDPLSNWE